MVDVIGFIVLLVAVNEGMLPEPFALRFIDGFELTQVNTVLFTAPEKLIAETAVLLQIT